MTTAFPAPLTPVRPKLTNDASSSPAASKIAMSWWEKTMIKRSSYAIENLLDHVVDKTPFLQKQQQQHDDHNSDLACLDRSEVQVGTLLGYGSFSNVYEVTAIRLKGDADDDDVDEEEEEREQQAVQLAEGKEEPTTSTTSYCRKRRRKHLAETALLTTTNSATTRYALKQLKPELVQNPDNFQAAACDLLVEAQYLACLDHDNILKLRGIARGGVQAYANSGSYDGFFLITDRLHETLQQRIQTWKDQAQLQLPIIGDSVNNDLAVVSLMEEKLDIALQIARALEYLHERRLIFRDLKPTNIGFKADNTVQLYDFGFCRQLPTPNDAANTSCSQQQPQDWCPTAWSMMLMEPEEADVTNDNAMYYMSGKGSLMYLANEVISTGRYNQKCDVYSWACIMFEMLSLEKPYPYVKTAEQHRAWVCDQGQRPVFLQQHHVPPRVQHIVEQSWTAQVTQRWSSAKVVRELEAVLADMEQGGTEIVFTPVMDEYHNTTPEACWMSGNALCTQVMDWVAELANDVCLGYKELAAVGIPKKEQHLKKQDSVVAFVEQQEEPVVEPLLAVVPSTPTVVSPRARSRSPLKMQTTVSTVEESVVSSRDESSSEFDPEPVASFMDQDRLFNSDMDDLEARCPASPLKPEEEFLIAWQKFATHMDTTVLTTTAPKNKQQQQTEDDVAWLLPPIRRETSQDF